MKNKIIFQNYIIGMFKKITIKQSLFKCLPIIIIITCTFKGQAQPGSPDLSFGIAGINTTQTGISSDYGRAMRLQTDEKMLVAGFSYNSSNNFDFLLVRYTTAGWPDSTFGNNGYISTSINTHDDYASCLAIQPDSKIILAGGSSYNGSNYEIAMVRYTCNGIIDSSFGAFGVVKTQIPGNPTSYANAITLQNDGKILIAARTFTGATNRFACLRYLQNGTIDSSFGSYGIVTTAFGGIDDEANAMAIQTDGKIIVSGWAYTGANDDYAMIRYKADGTADSTFGTNGKVTTDVGGNFDYVYAMAIQTDNKIVLSGYSILSSDDVSMARYLPNGALDTGFGVNGKVITTVGAGSDAAYAVCIQDNGKILLSGNSVNGLGNTDALLLRYNSDGLSDNSFGTSGIVRTDVNGNNDQSFGLATQSDGKILSAGSSSDGSYNKVLVIRYNTDISVNTSEHNTTQFDIFPNPASDYVIISNIENNYNQAVLINMQGQQIKEFQLSTKEFKLDISTIPSGLYLLNIKSSNSMMQQKLVIQ